MEDKTKMEELISVVIPVYNTELCALDYCLSCIEAQTYSNFEVICVDGGSSNGAINVIKNYLRDKRFKLIETNANVSTQRNIGIERSIGDYILFIDSDDFFSPQFITLLYSNIKIHSCDVAIPLFHRCDFKEGTLIAKKPYEVSQINEKVTQANYFKYGRPGELVNPIKLYKRSLIGDTRFIDKCSYGEDMLFNYELSKKGFTTCLVPEANYNYRVLVGVNNTKRRLDNKGLFIVKALASIIRSKEIKDKESLIGLYSDFDFVFKEFYYSLARQKRIGGLVWMMQFKPLYFKRHHNIHDILFLLFPIMIVSRRTRKGKSLKG